MFKQSSVLLPLAAALLLGACATTPGSGPKGIPQVANLGAPTAQVARLEAGRALYLGKCTKCHTAEPIAKHSLEDWKDDILPEMSKKAKLSAEENAAVLAYVQAAHGATAR